MKYCMRGLILLALAFCLLAFLCGCGDDASGDARPDRTEETAAAVPEPISDLLELDGVTVGRVCVREGALYFMARDLSEARTADLTEPADGVLLLRLDAGDFTLHSGSNEILSEAGPILLGAPVLCDGSEWYLPLDAMNSLLGRTYVYDRASGTLRCLRLEPGPEVRVDGSKRFGSFTFGGEPLVPAESFAELTRGSADASTAADGCPMLTLCAGERVLRFREGAVEAELDGEALALPSPAWREGETWYLPLGPTAEALRCIAVSDATADRTELYLGTEGRMLWFNGRFLGRTYDFGGVPCAGLCTLSEALSGSLEESGDSAVLNAVGRSLRFEAGSLQIRAGKAALSMPAPVIRGGGDWYVPLVPLAEALDLGIRGDESCMIFSRVEPRSTELLVNGVTEEAFGVAEGPCCVRLRDVAEASGGSFRAEENEAELEVWGRHAVLSGGSSDVRIGTSEITLGSPVMADGREWYAPAELLTSLGFSEFVDPDPDLDRVYYTHVVRHDEVAKGFRIPVFMYHAVSDFIWGNTELFVSPSELEAQLQALAEGGYTPITFEDLDRIEEIENPVMLTFDDGYDDNYTQLFPLLKKYNVKATVFVITNDIGIIHKLTEAQIREMSESGLVSIQSHTMSHMFLAGLYGDYLHREHYGSMLRLTRITGKQPFVLCYPTGVSSDYSRSVTAQYYEYGLCMGGPCYVTGDPPYYICRYYVPRFLPLETFLSYLE